MEVCEYVEGITSRDKVITWLAVVGGYSLSGEASSVGAAKEIAYTAGCKLSELVIEIASIKESFVIYKGRLIYRLGF